MTSTTIYIIYVRPRGSVTWTQYMKSNGVPWRTSSTVEANKEAVIMANTTNYCARVVAVHLPESPDSEDAGKYSVLADGDTLYVSSTI